MTTGPAGAELFRLTPAAAETVRAEVSAAVSRWRQVARGLNVTENECEAMAPAFLA